jgi:hypothetical protein
MFGGGGVMTAGEQAISDCRFLIEICKLVVDPQVVSDRLAKLHEEGKRIEGARAELGQKERELIDRERACDALDHEADGSADAAGLYEVLHWVIGHQRHTLRERIAMCHRLINLKGRQVGTPRELTGWR